MNSSKFNKLIETGYYLSSEELITKINQLDKRNMVQPEDNTERTVKDFLRLDGPDDAESFSFVNSNAISRNKHSRDNTVN